MGYFRNFIPANEQLLAVKSVKQPCSVEPLQPLMETFRRMVNDCIMIGLQNDASTMKRLSNLCYPALLQYNIISYYKLHAISKAAGILANRKQSMRRGYPTKTPHLKKKILVSCYGFKITNSMLKVPLGNRQYFDIPLNKNTKQILSDAAVTVHSFTLNACNTMSICYSKEVTEIECTTIAGVGQESSQPNRWQYR